jgi:hypothetical protein
MHIWQDHKSIILINRNELKQTDDFRVIRLHYGLNNMQARENIVISAFEKKKGMREMLEKGG